MGLYPSIVHELAQGVILCRGFGYGVTGDGLEIVRGVTMQSAILGNQTLIIHSRMYVYAKKRTRMVSPGCFWCPGLGQPVLNAQLLAQLVELMVSTGFALPAGKQSVCELLAVVDRQLVDPDCAFALSCA